MIYICSVIRIYNRDYSRISKFRLITTYYLDFLIRLVQRNRKVESFKLASALTDSLIGGYFQSEGSDKGSESGSSRHNYEVIYQLLFANSRGSMKNILEIGIGSSNPNIKSSMGKLGIPGASLRAFSNYFYNGEVYGLDIDPDALVNESRIHSYICDQTSLDSLATVRATFLAQGKFFDLIIDDGLHTFDAFKKTFEAFNELLAQNGTYIVEDIIGWKENKYIKEIPSDKFDTFYFSGISKSKKNHIVDNNLLVIRKKFG